MAGKGCVRRPMLVSMKVYVDNYNHIFKNNRQCKSRCGYADCGFCFHPSEKYKECIGYDTCSLYEEYNQEFFNNEYSKTIEYHKSNNNE